MTIAHSCALIRSDQLDSYITRAGTGAMFKRYNGVMPASTLAALNANTLLETFVWSGVPIGTSNGTTIDINEAAADRHPWEPEVTMNFFRRDGSVADW